MKTTSIYVISVNYTSLEYVGDLGHLQIKFQIHRYLIVFKNVKIKTDPEGVNLINLFFSVTFN